MLKKIKNLIELTRSAKEQGVAMRRRLLVYWCSLVLIVFAALMLILSACGVLSDTENDLYNALSLRHEHISEAMDSQIGALTAQGVFLSEQLTPIFSRVLEGEPISALNNDAESLTSLEAGACTLMNTSIKSGSFNGIYFVADATINTEAPIAETSRAGVYLRFANLSTKDSVLQDVVYYRGIADVARVNRLELHNRWNLEFDTEMLTGYHDAMRLQDVSLVEGSYWTGRINLTDTWENVMLLVVPIFGGDGSVIGVCGVELSDTYFRMLYPCGDSEFGDMVTVLAPVKDGKLDLSAGLTGCLGATFLDDSDVLRVNGGRHFNTYKGESGTFCGIQSPINMKMADGSEMYVATLVSENGYAASVFQSRLILTGTFLALLVLTIVLSVFLSRRFVRPIEASLSALKAEEEGEFLMSGILEIDELIAYLRNKAQEQEEAELPPNIEELFCTFAERVKTLTPTERTILQYYIDGCTLEEVAEKAFISINTAKKHNTNLNRKLGVRSREELSLYIDLFRRGNRLDDITYMK